MNEVILINTLKELSEQIGEMNARIWKMECEQKAIVETIAERLPEEERDFFQIVFKSKCQIIWTDSLARIRARSPEVADDFARILDQLDPEP